MSPKVEIQRTDALPVGTDATYEQDGDSVVVLMRADLISDRGAQLISRMCEDALRESWRPRVPLLLVEGGRG